MDITKEMNKMCFKELKMESITPNPTEITQYQLQYIKLEYMPTIKDQGTILATAWHLSTAQGKLDDPKATGSEST